MEYILNYYLYRELQEQIKNRKKELTSLCRKLWANKYTGLVEYPDFLHEISVDPELRYLYFKLDSLIIDGVKVDYNLIRIKGGCV